MTSAASDAGSSGTSRIPLPYHEHSALHHHAPPRGSLRHESTACLPDVSPLHHAQHHDVSPQHHHHHHLASPFPPRRASTLAYTSNYHDPLAPLDAHSARRRPQQQQQPPSAAARSTSRLSILSADKVESQTKTVASSKSKAHSRLASFGRQRLRGIVSIGDAPAQGETLPRVPVSPSDASSQHKRSDASTRSNTSSETTLTDDAKSDIKSLDERPSLVDAATWLDGENTYDLYEYERLLKRSPRMMHQTSSKLLRMTDDERPFTRVCPGPTFR